MAPKWSLIPGSSAFYDEDLRKSFAYIETGPRGSPQKKQTLERQYQMSIRDRLLKNLRDNANRAANSKKAKVRKGPRTVTMYG